MAIVSLKVAFLLPFMALVSSAPSGPSYIPKYKRSNVTSVGTQKNQGTNANIATASTSTTLSALSKLSTKLRRNGVGSEVSGAGLDWYSSSLIDGEPGYYDPQYYSCFNGPASNFPPSSGWMSFNDMFDLNQHTSLDQEENGPAQGALYNAIVNVAADSKVDARFILAIIMQESTGNVNVGCTNNGVENCGLMQAYAGSVSYDSNDPQGSITQMVVDGTQGTVQGPGLVQWFNSEDSVNYDSGGNVYNVARGYNSGSIDFSNLSDGMGSTASYVSDIANRLQGWNGNDGEGYKAACGF